MGIDCIAVNVVQTYPRDHRAKAGLHAKQVSGLLHGNIERQAFAVTHTPTASSQSSRREPKQIQRKYANTTQKEPGSGQ